MIYQKITVGKEQGGVLIAVLTLSSLMLTVILFIFAGFKNTQELTLAEKFALERSNQSLEKLFDAQNNPSALKVEALNRQATLVRMSNHQPSTASITLANKKGVIPTPSWRKLEQNKRQICSRVNSKPVAFQSGYTCRSLEKEASYIEGNLKLKEEVSLGSKVLFVRGSLETSQTLKLEGDSSRITIIAVSDLKLEAIETNSQKIREILIYSPKGSVSIKALGANISLCQSQKVENNKIRLGILAPAKKNARDWESSQPGWLGCNLKTTGPLWPNAELLAILPP